MNKMNSMVVVGAQWGDEGKGKIIDYLASEADVVARFQGGDNAGHTVVYGANIFKLHHVPSGILYPDTLCLLGNGMVVNPLVLVEELEELTKRGINTANLRISGKAHLILDYHQMIDVADETMRAGQKIGTTGRGIGPAYADKALRRGIRAWYMTEPEGFRRKLSEVLPMQNKILKEIYGVEGIDYEEMVARYLPVFEKLAPMVTDITTLLLEKFEEGRLVLFEGAQGALLDIDHGTYPFVTSSSTVAGAAATGTGVGPKYVSNVLGVMKAYATRVGEGPFPSEDHSEAGNQLRQIGNEYGTTTGRPRRCGWFDAVVARYASIINGLTGIAITKLDVLSGMEMINLAVAYRCGEKILKNFPSGIDELEDCSPVYESFQGWDEDISHIRSLEDLPSAARHYLKALEETVGVRIEIVSVGPDRSQTIVSSDSHIKNWISGAD